ncbi:phosphotransferase [Micropruina sp.]|uniref:phosphotransferase n=1 Tax=Micropruina sp. TaxID=2737536 RepID=UPI0026276C7C|nr:phosphotransferase [Micropruina sp.]
MTEQPLAAWWEAISGARWFAGKGLSATLAELTPLPWLTPIGQLPAVRPEIATIRYAGGADEQYLLLVGYTTEPEGAVVGSVTEPGLGAVHVVQASADGACMRALLRALTDPEHPAMEWLDASAIDPEAPSRVWRGDQSNTTICLAEDRLFKLFRKLEPGRNLDVEVLAALSGSEVTPALYGTLVGELPGGGQADLGMFVERIQGVRDGWEWACEMCADERDIAPEASDLGRALAQVHTRLADAFGTSAASGAELASAMVSRLDAAVAQVPALADVRNRAEAVFRALDGAELATQRVHGDFHLGQVLRGSDSWTIIDFEGEPLKPLAERRRPDSVWRDVAGMLRSFDYVRGAHPDPTSSRAGAWSRSARRAFLDGYCSSAAPEPSVLHAYELDKAVYEVVYETRNRPEWVHIPLGAVHDVAGRTT